MTARDAETVREHARIGGFPYEKIAEARRVLDPTSLDLFSVSKADALKGAD